MIPHSLIPHKALTPVAMFKTVYMSVFVQVRVMGYIVKARIVDRVCPVN